MKEFILKALVVTFCIGLLLHLFCPKYYFPEFNKRCNILSGECSTKDFYGWGSR